MPTTRTWLKWLLLTPPALALLWLGGPAIWLLWAGVLVVPSVWKGRWRWRAPALLLTPVAVAVGGFASGVLGYATGTATFEGMGLPGPEYFNLDRVTRAPPTSGGCVVFGPEFLTMVPNNAAVKLLGALFGPMPRSYRGPYPTSEEAKALLDASSTQVDASTLERGTVMLNGDVFRISRWRRFEKPVSARATRMGQDLVVIEQTSERGSVTIDLTSLEHGPVAVYLLR